MVSGSKHRENGGRERSGRTDSRRNHAQPDGSANGNPPVAQDRATPLAGRQEREAGQLGLVQRHPQHRRRSHERRPDRPQREVGEHQLPTGRGTENRHAESRFRVAEQDDGRQAVRFRIARRDFRWRQWRSSRSDVVTPPAVRLPTRHWKVAQLVGGKLSNFTPES